MTRLLTLCLGLVAAALLWAQTRRPGSDYPMYEYRELLPQETTPARYKQVDRWEVDRVSREGWELVAVSPYVYLNEERGAEGKPKAMVTQTYPAYYFRRMARERP